MFSQPIIRVSILTRFSNSCKNLGVLLALNQPELKLAQDPMRTGMVVMPSPGSAVQQAGQHRGGLATTIATRKVVVVVAAAAAVQLLGLAIAAIVTTTGMEIGTETVAEIGTITTAVVAMATAMAVPRRQELVPRLRGRRLRVPALMGSEDMAATVLLVHPARLREWVLRRPLLA
jgi:hypothetical protein